MYIDHDDGNKTSGTDTESENSGNGDNHNFSPDIDLEPVDQFEIVLEESGGDWHARVDGHPGYGDHVDDTPGDALAQLSEQFDTDVESDESAVRADGGRDPQAIANDLTKFQDKILEILSVRDFYGLAIKERLSQYYQAEVNHGRLYPNLDELVELGLVEKGELDRRTNEYSLTELGRRVVQFEHGWTSSRLEGEDVDTEEQ